MSRTRSSTLPSDRASDRAPDRRDGQGLRGARDDGRSNARPRHLSAEEQADKDANDILTRRKLATLVARRRGVDPGADPPVDAALICVAWEFHELADALGLNSGAR